MQSEGTRFVVRFSLHIVLNAYVKACSKLIQLQFKMHAMNDQKWILLKNSVLTKKHQHCCAISNKYCSTCICKDVQQIRVPPRMAPAMGPQTLFLSFSRWFSFSLSSCVYLSLFPFLHILFHSLICLSNNGILKQGNTWETEIPFLF